MSRAADAGNGAKRDLLREPSVLPQWALDAARPLIRLVSGALWRISYTGEENIPDPNAGGLIVAANHQTYFDPFWVGAPIRRPLRFLAWNEAFKWPALGKSLELLGAWPLNVERADRLAYQRSLQWLRGGGAVVIFPEGARACADGVPAKFKAGAVRLALEACVPILPVTIHGANEVWPREQTLPRLGRVRIEYHTLFRLSCEPRDKEAEREYIRQATKELSDIITSPIAKHVTSSQR